MRLLLPRRGRALFFKIAFSSLTAYLAFYFALVLPLVGSGMGAALAQTSKAAPREVRIAIIDFGGRVSEESVRKNIVDTMRKSYQRSSRYRPVDESAVASYISLRQDETRLTRLEAVKKAMKLLRDGKSSYQQMKTADAIERLSLAKREFIGSLNVLKSNDSLLEAYLYLGMAYLTEGDEQQAYSEFKKALFLDSKINLSAKEYSPRVLSVFERAKQDIDALAKGTVLIDSTPSNCAVYINGKNAGITPVNTLLPVGEYFVKVEKEGYLDWYQLVSVEDKVNSIDVELYPVSADEGLIIALKPVPDIGSMDPASMAILKDAGRKLSADIVMLGWIDRDVRDILSVQLYDLRSNKLSYVVQGNLGKNFSGIDNGIDRLVADLNSYIDQRGYVVAMEEVKTKEIPLSPQPATPTPQMIAEQKKKNWKSKWWVWALLGGLAAGAGYGIYAGVAASSGKISVNNQGNF